MGSKASKTKSHPLDAQMYEAITSCDLDKIRELHAHGANLDFVNGVSPLHHACNRSDGFDCAKLLVELGANIHEHGQGEYPVHVAARRGQYQTLKMLVDNGASLLVLDGSNETPLTVAPWDGGLLPLSIVRLIESQICLFCGHMRHQFDISLQGIPAFDGPNNYGWVVLVPTGRDLHLEIRVYHDELSSHPMARLSLQSPNLHIMNPKSATQTLVAEDTQRRSRVLLQGVLERYKRGEESQVEALLRACVTKTRVNKHPIPTHPILSRPFPPVSPPLHRPFPRNDTSRGDVPKSQLIYPPRPPNNSQNESSNSEEDELVAAVIESLKPEYMDPPPIPKHTPQSRPQPKPQPHRQPPPPLGTHSQTIVRGQNYPTPSAPPFIRVEAFTSVGKELGGRIEVGRDGGGNMEEKCAICWEDSRDMACVPCGHVACCMRCLTTVFESGNKKCPTCRAKLTGVLKVYL